MARMKRKAAGMGEPSQSPQGDSYRQAKPSLVIGVGASTGAMNSIERFFSKFPRNPQQAVVLVLQHREAFNEEWLRGILRNGAQLAAASDGADIKGDTIYLCAADTITTIQGNGFVVRPARGGVDAY